MPVLAPVMTTTLPSSLAFDLHLGPCIHHLEMKKIYYVK
jgi:hypothetical protein